MGRKVNVAVETDIGQVRHANEDAYWVQAPWFAIADGMGGHSAGEVASRLATEAVKKVAEQHNQPWQVAVKQAIHEANEAVWQRARHDAVVAGMGTTLTIMVLQHDECIIGHVGDSRCYMLRDKTLQQLTNDHSVVAELIQTGTLTEKEASIHPQRNMLTRAIGTSPQTNPDIVRTPVQSGDIMLLCTDGLNAVLSDDDIASVLQTATSLSAAAEQLIHAANERGGPDNITVIIVEV